MNRGLIRPILKLTLYKTYKRRNSNIYHIHVFGCKFFLLSNWKDNLGKFDAKSNEVLFLGYSTSRKTFQILNKHILTIIESIHISLNENNPNFVEIKVFDCAGILDKTLLEDKKPTKDINQIEEKDKDQNEYKNNDEVEETNKHQYLPID